MIAISSRRQLSGVTVRQCTPDARSRLPSQKRKEGLCTLWLKEQGQSMISKKAPTIIEALLYRLKAIFNRIKLNMFPVFSLCLVCHVACGPLLCSGGALSEQLSQIFIFCIESKSWEQSRTLRGILRYRYRVMRGNNSQFQPHIHVLHSSSLLVIVLLSLRKNSSKAPLCHYLLAC